MSRIIQSVRCSFTYVEQPESGLHLTGDAKSLLVVQSADNTYLLVGTNNVGVSTYKLQASDHRLGRSLK